MFAYTLSSLDEVTKLDSSFFHVDMTLYTKSVSWLLIPEADSAFPTRKHYYTVCGTV